MPTISKPLKYQRAHYYKQERHNALLSKRDLFILQKMADGKSTGQIADALGCTYGSINDAKSRLWKRLNVRNACHAVAWAYRTGTIPLIPIILKPNQN